MNPLMILPLISLSLDPNLDIIKKNCKDEIDISAPKTCNAGGPTIAHCDDHTAEGQTYYCFNEHWIFDEGKSANKMMKSYLCGELELSAPDISLKFGNCFADGEKIESPGIMNCECVSQQWVCQTEKVL